ncbi:MAG: hypothetical protein ACKVZ0_23325 [Gemmatimonadales bacterium]
MSQRPQVIFDVQVYWLLATLTLFGCRKSPTAPPDPDPITATPPTLFSVGSPAKDEDPSVLLDRAGRLHLAWFSDRDGNAELYIANSGDGLSWSPAAKIATSQWGDFYPNLIQDDQGTFHVVWFQWVSLFLGQIRHRSSADGITWGPEDIVTREFLTDDWVPTVSQAPNGSLVVYFVAAKRVPNSADNQIYAAVKRPGQTQWDSPVSLSINSSTHHDHLPFVARTGPNQLTLVWVRFAGSADFITNSRSDLFVATSADGLAWSTPALVTTDQRGQNLFPQLYQRHGGAWYLVFLSTASGQDRRYEIPASSLGSSLTGLVENPLLPAGYSHRLTRTARSGEYLAAWVQGSGTALDIYTRLITR